MREKTGNYDSHLARVEIAHIFLRNAPFATVWKHNHPKSKSWEGWHQIACDPIKNKLKKQPYVLPSESSLFR
jgi:hypothetical protein